MSTLLFCSGRIEGICVCTWQRSTWFALSAVQGCGKACCSFPDSCMPKSSMIVEHGAKLTQTKMGRKRLVMSLAECKSCV